MPVSGGTALTIYRLVQESLSNTLRHASEARSAVATVRWGADQVVVDVVDDGRAPIRAGLDAGRGAGRGREAGGHGLLGMRERVHAHGGSLRTGPDPDAGWRVTAQLPVTASHPGSAS
ncbi:sensor histidine kinase [Serinibacter arcticus]|uniref:sensor histidine kinase n=1 Tax=Serinibacter arcticus TaxID=1655435 RepID=UPI0013049B73|nr:ATP-binding protein [Serinibacter arcticus]